MDDKDVESSSSNDQPAADSVPNFLEGHRRSVLQGLGATTAILAGGTSLAAAQDSETEEGPAVTLGDQIEMIPDDAEVLEDSDNVLRAEFRYDERKLQVRVFKQHGNHPRAGEVDLRGVDDSVALASTQSTWEQVVVRSRTFLTKDGKLWYGGASVTLTENAERVGKAALTTIVAGLLLAVPTGGTSLVAAAVILTVTFVTAILLEFNDLREFSFGLLDRTILNVPYHNAVIRRGYTSSRSGVRAVNQPSLGYWRNSL